MGGAAGQIGDPNAQINAPVEGGDAAPAVPVAVQERQEVAPETDPKKEIQAERRDAQEVPGILDAEANPGEKPTEKPAEKTTEDPEMDETKKTIASLPAGKLKEICKSMYQQILEDPSAVGPLMIGSLRLMIMVAKSGVILDNIPYMYVKRLEKMAPETDEAKEKAKKDAEEIARNTARDEAREKLSEEQKQAFGPDQDRAGAKYVCQAMWGKDFGVESVDDLAAKILHAKNEKDERYYRPAQHNELKKMGMPYGTVLVFKLEVKNPQKIVAFATGHEDEFKYYDSRDKVVKIFRLKDYPKPCIQAFVPKFNSDPVYFGTPPEKGKEKFEVMSELDNTAYGDAKSAKDLSHKLANEAEDFKVRLQSDPDLLQSSTSYLFDLIKENETEWDELMLSLDKVKSESALKGLQEAIISHKESIEVAIKCNEAKKEYLKNKPSESPDQANKTEKEIQELDGRITYLKQTATDKGNQYAGMLENAIVSLKQN